MRKWTLDDSIELYNINRWGSKYFGIDGRGLVYATPKEGGPKIPIKKIVEDMQLNGIFTPLLIRFPEIIANRFELISNCFRNAKEEYEYQNTNYIVYPIKVNQMRPVVEEVLNLDDEYNIGLEAGSKPELHAVLAASKSDESLIICNGYKDEEFIELALLATKMGKQVYIVVEKLSELRTISKLAKELKVMPNIGIRVKLSSSGSGKWEDSGGDRSKFGLTASELLEAFEIAQKDKILDRIKLIHFHLGSQITNIRKIKLALREATQFYVQMKLMGCGLEYIDIGGGLGVDYDGFRSIGKNSLNYSIQEYINDAVFNVVESCNAHNIPHPGIITESGRAVTAHHSVLVFDVLEKTSPSKWKDKDTISDDEHELVKELYEVYSSISKTGMFESWHDAQEIREEALDLFALGMFDLRSRALMERLFWSIARKVYDLSKELKHEPRELQRLSQILSDKLFCNFSLFQSLPDSWAIDQVFPIMPIHRLKEKPKLNATIQDLTCDSDGKINNFIGMNTDAYSLPVHDIKKGEPYYIAAFLVGAYQEILGDMHNLFGDTNVVHVVTRGDKYKIKQVIEGETVSDVLGYVQFNAKNLVRSIEKSVKKAVAEDKITSAEGREFISKYSSGLYGYTYFEK